MLEDPSSPVLHTIYAVNNNKKTNFLLVCFPELLLSYCTYSSSLVNYYLGCLICHLIWLYNLLGLLHSSRHVQCFHHAYMNTRHLELLWDFQQLEFLCSSHSAGNICSKVIQKILYKFTSKCLCFKPFCKSAFGTSLVVRKWKCKNGCLKATCERFASIPTIKPTHDGQIMLEMTFRKSNLLRKVISFC